MPSEGDATYAELALGAVDTFRDSKTADYYVAKLDDLVKKFAGVTAISSVEQGSLAL